MGPQTLRGVLNAWLVVKGLNLETLREGILGQSPRALNQVKVSLFFESQGI